MDVFEVEVLVELEEDGDVEMGFIEDLVFVEDVVSGGIVVNHIGVICYD